MSYQSMAPPPPPAPVTTSTAAVPTKIRPSVAWYWIGGLLIAAGIIGALVILGIWAARASDAVDNFARMKVTPGTSQGQGFNFARAGTYTLYYEYRSKVDNEKIVNDDHDPPSQLQVAVADEQGKDVAVRPYDKDFAFSVNDKLGPAFARVTIPAPGLYTVTVDSNATSPFVVAIGKGVLQSIWPWWLLGAIAAFVVGVGLGLASIISTAVRRGRRKREQRRALAATTGYGYGVPATYPPAYAPAPAPVPVQTPAPAPPGPETWTAPPSSAPPPSATPPASPGWGEPGGAPPASSPSPPPADDDPWGPPRG